MSFRYLSKSKILEGLQCPKRLWLTVYRPELAEVTAGAELRLQAGLAVHDVFRTIFPDGVLIDGDDGLGEAISATEKVIQLNAERIFEATFSESGVLVRADLLEKQGGSWRLVEAKSSTAVKNYHLQDAAIQARVLERSGLPLISIQIAHIDNSFLYPGGSNYQGLFAFEDVTEQVRPLQYQVDDWVSSLRETLAGAEPCIAPGDQCYDPYECPYCVYCTPEEDGQEFPVELLPGSSRLESILIEEGYRDLRDVPPERLANERQLMVWQAVTTGKPQVREALIDELRRVDHPRYYLDFETISFAIPIWAGTRPYQQLPFQYSCHVEDRDGSLRHLEFLDLSGQAPMESLAKQMITDLGTVGPVITYGHFERMIIDVLIELYPDLEFPLRGIQDRIFDLLPLLRANYYHPQMNGSWSIKAVLPTVAPELRYDTLDEVQDGSGAQEAYLEAIHHNTCIERRKELRQKMLQYCGQDSLAMMKIMKHLINASHA